MSGVVAELISVQRPETTTALEIAAGGKLYNVVVDTETTGKLLLSKGNLKRRVTIIPLNKIRPQVASRDTVKAAEAEVRSVPTNDSEFPVILCLFVLMNKGNTTPIHDADFQTLDVNGYAKTSSFRGFVRHIDSDLVRNILIVGVTLTRRKILSFIPSPPCAIVWPHSRSAGRMPS